MIKPKSRICNEREKVSAQKQVSYLSSLISENTSCGLHNTPWILQAEPGQQINITLVDFSWNNNKSNTDNGYNGRCNYGYILDVESDDVISLCGGREREKHLYLSTSHTVQVVLDSLALQKYSFLIAYKG